MTPDEGQGWVAATTLPLTRLCLYRLSSFLECHTVSIPEISVFETLCMEKTYDYGQCTKKKYHVYVNKLSSKTFRLSRKVIAAIGLDYTCIERN
jgi:hypothetical protein